VKRHTISVKDISDWKLEHWVQFAASIGERSNKRLEVNLGGLYRVTDHDKVLYIGGKVETAIREYNDAR